MTPEFLYGLVGVILGGLISTVTSFVTTWIGQNGEARKMRVEIWREQYKSLQDVLSQMLLHPIDQKGANPLGAAMFAYRARLSIATPILHLLSKSDRDELNSLSALIGKAWVDEQRGALDPNTVAEIVSKMPSCEQKLLAEIENRLEALSEKLASL